MGCEQVPPINTYNISATIAVIFIASGESLLSWPQVPQLILRFELGDF